MQTNLASIQAPKPEVRTQPVWESRVGAFTVRIWENGREFNGRRVTMRNVALTKQFRDKSGEVRSSTSYLMERELPRVLEILQEAARQLSGGDPEREVGQ